MSNRVIALMLMSGLSMSSVSAEFIANNYSDAEFSRYQHVEEMADSYVQDTGYESLSEQMPDNTPGSYYAQQPAMAENICDDVTLFDSRCINDHSKTRNGLKLQVDYLKKYPPYRRFADRGVNVSSSQLMSTAHGALRWLDNQKKLTESFDLIDISNYHSRQTKFTGYYTPEIAASRTYSHEYRYPVYSNPKDHRIKLSRAEIERGALKGSGLELAWVNNPIDLFYIQMQGSGVLVFENGERKALDFAATNGLPFKSIANYMKSRGYLNGDLSRRAITKWLYQHPETMGEVFGSNPRYVFFTMKNEPSSASGLSLIPGHTVAVDTSFIPFGAVLLAEVPKFDNNGKPAGYEWRMLFPQDRGNAIKGQARIDLYTGTGEYARQWANKVTGFRRAYLLLNKDDGLMKTAAVN